MRKDSADLPCVCFVFALSAMAFDDMGKSATVNGWISDSKCGAKGANAGRRSLHEEVPGRRREDGRGHRRRPEGAGRVDNPDALKGHEGHHVAVTGTCEGDSIHVTSVKML